MEENKTECQFCASLRLVKEINDSHKEARPSSVGNYETECRASLVAEDYYIGNGEREYSGRVTHSSVQLNFCPECGRQIPREETLLK